MIYVRSHISLKHGLCTNIYVKLHSYMYNYTSNSFYLYHCIIA